MSDPRFTVLQNDPRYRLPSRKEARTTVDPRFKTLFSDHDFRKNASVDRYGRRITDRKGQKELSDLYRLDEQERPAKRPRTAAKAAPESLSESEDAGKDGESAEGEGRAGARDVMREGFSDTDSEDESENEEDSESEAELELAELTAGVEQSESIPMGEVSRRIAAVNLDWDHIRAADIMAVAQSFVPSGAQIASVVIYPSEFGRERLEKEELEGPPREIFASSSRLGGESDEEDESDEDEKIKKRLLVGQADDGAEFDTAKLRQYQLERLRYYYAVLNFSSPAAAKAVYDNLDGREYLTSANFFDLRFIPDDVDFSDDQPRETCDKLHDGYRPNEFKTEALTHSKVRLTWDDDDTTRKDVQRRAFSRAEMDENDMKAYIASDSSDADSVSSRKSMTMPEQRRARKQDAEKQRMREALGLAAESTKSRPKDADAPVGEMQITFSSGLSGEKQKNGVFENEPQDEESTKERYIRKEKDRKQKRKERMKGAKDVIPAHGVDLAEESADVEGGAAGNVTADLGFDDPFFVDMEAAAVAEKKIKSTEKAKKREARAAENLAAASKKAELELLMADDHGDVAKHFDMREIEKAEKQAKRKIKKGKRSKQSGEQDGSAQENAEEFVVDAADPRFKAMYESHEYAIDPTNAKFKGTTGMKTLLEAGRKRKPNDEEGVISKWNSSRHEAGTVHGNGEVRDLAKRLKKSKPRHA